MATQQIDATTGDAFELTWPDGSVLRLRWNASEKGVRVSAETFGSLAAQELVVRPRAANMVILQAEVT